MSDLALTLVADYGVTIVFLVTFLVVFLVVVLVVVLVVFLVVFLVFLLRPFTTHFACLMMLLVHPHAAIALLLQKSRPTPHTPHGL